MTLDRVRRAVESSDTDELIRIVDGLAVSRDWDGMLDLRHRCDEAVERGKQLWAIPEYIRYRLALEAPPEWAGPAVTEGPTRFTLGPLPEVVASRLTWKKLEPHLDPGPERAMVAQECVIRSEGAIEDPTAAALVDLPLVRAKWEPRYPMATYYTDRLEAPPPPTPTWEFADLIDDAQPIDDPDGLRALESVTEHWVAASNGRSQTSCVHGEAASAVAALGVKRAAITAVEPGHALAWIAWAAASGGAYARRRGAAAGRFAAWWVAHELGDLPWPPDPDDLGREVNRLQWYLWHDGAPDLGWSLRLAVHSAEEEISWALAAQDAE